VSAAGEAGPFHAQRPQQPEQKRENRQRSRVGQSIQTFRGHRSPGLPLNEFRATKAHFLQMRKATENQEYEEWSGGSALMKTEDSAALSSKSSADQDFSAPMLEL
jgi:hypothetical protein